MTGETFFKKIISNCCQISCGLDNCQGLLKKKKTAKNSEDFRDEVA